MEEYTKLSSIWNRPDIVFDKYGRLINVCKGSSYRDIVINGSLVYFNDDIKPIYKIMYNNLTNPNNIKKYNNYYEEYYNENHEKIYYLNLKKFHTKNIYKRNINSMKKNKIKQKGYDDKYLYFYYFYDKNININIEYDIEELYYQCIYDNIIYNNTYYEEFEDFYVKYI